LGGNDFCIDVWVKTDGSTRANTETIFQKGGESGVSDLEYFLSMDVSGLLGFAIKVNGSTFYNINGTIAVDDQNWHHIAGVRSGSNLYLFVGGVYDGTDTPTGSILQDDDATLLVGAQPNTPSLITSFSGNIDEFRLLNGSDAISDANDPLYIPGVPTDGFTPPTAAYNPDYSTYFLDSSASAHDVTSNGDAQVSAVDPKFSENGLFDATGDYLSIPDSTDFDFGTADWCIDFWLRGPVSQPGSVAGVVGSRDSSDTGWGIYFVGGRDLRVAYGAAQVLADSGTYDTNTWTHYAIFRYGSTLYMMRDGNVVDSVAASGSYDGASSFAVGRYYVDVDNYYFEGRLDELRVSKGNARIDDSNDPLYISSGDPLDGFTPPTAPYDGSYPRSSRFSARSSALTFPVARFSARSDSLIPKFPESRFSARADSLALTYEARFSARASSNKYQQARFSARTRSFVQEGWQLWAYNVGTTVWTDLGFIDAEGSHTIVDAALADGDYEFEARPIHEHWVQSSGGTRTPVTISATPVSGAPTIDIFTGVNTGGVTTFDWEISGQADPGLYGFFHLWSSATTPVDTTGRQTTRSLYTEAQVYRRIHRQTTDLYWAIRYVEGSLEGPVTEIYVAKPVTGLEAPEGVFADV